MVGEDELGTLFLGHVHSFHCSTDTVTTQVQYLGEPSEAEKDLRTHLSPWAAIEFWIWHTSTSKLQKVLAVQLWLGPTDHPCSLRLIIFV